MRRLQRDGREWPAGVALLPAEATASAGRFFLGVALTNKARHATQRHLEAVEIPGRFVLSKDWHLTLRFIGETRLLFFGLALILIFGRSGALSAVLFEVFGVPRSRWIYGLPGVLIEDLGGNQTRNVLPHQIKVAA